MVVCQYFLSGVARILSFDLIFKVLTVLAWSSRQYLKRS